MRITIEWTQRDDGERLSTTDPWQAQTVIEELCGQDQRGNRYPGTVEVEDGEHSFTFTVDAHWCPTGYCSGNHYSWEDIDLTAEIGRYEERNSTDDGAVVVEAAA